MKKWMYAELYLPNKMIPREFNLLEIIDKQEDNWGMIKAGKLGGKKSAELLKKNLVKRVILN